MPTSEMKAVPPGRIWWSAVGTWVWVPTTRLARPSQKKPMPCFSLDASPWKSTTIASAASRSGQASSSRLSTAKGSSNGVMKTRPMALIPGVIAERDGIGAGVEEFLIDRLGDAETAGGILALDDDGITGLPYEPPS